MLTRMLELLLIVITAAVVRQMNVSSEQKKQNYTDYKKAKEEFNKAVDRVKKS